MSHRFQFRSAVFAVSLFLVASVFGQTTEGELQDQMFVEIAEAQKLLKGFYAKYEAALDRLEKSAQDEGTLQGVLAIRAERKAFLTRETSPEQPANYPPLAKLQQIFHTEKDQLRENIAEAELAARIKYADGLEELVKQLTTESKLEEAIAMRAKAEAARKNLILPSHAKAKGGEIVFDAENSDFKETKGVTAQRKGDLLELRGLKFESYIASRKEYTTPVTLHARAMTDSSNIRLYFNNYPMAVFNWEGNYSDMKMRHLETNKRITAKGVGKIETNQMHDFKVEITAKKVRIFANGELRTEVDGNFAKLKGTLGIGPAHGSVVTVESLSVESNQ